MAIQNWSYRVLTLMMSTVLLCATQNCNVKAQIADPRLQRTAKQVLGQEMITDLSMATRMEVFQLGPTYSPLGPKAARIDGYTLVATVKEQGKAFAARLAAALMDDQIYRTGGSMCFSPHIAFRAWHESKYIDVLICFHCGNLQIHSSDGGPDKGASLASSRHPTFIDLAKEAFPSDASIQSLDSTVYHIRTKDHRIVTSVKY